MRDGWRNDATAQMAEQIQEDPLLLLEAIDRIHHLARGQTLARIIDQAGHEAAAAWYGRLDTPPPRPDGVDWQQIGEHLLQRMLRNSVERDI
jgi:hypothetical protein